jgi:hypothetical protein
MGGICGGSPRGSTVASTLALFLALGGSATAAAVITSRDGMDRADELDGTAVEDGARVPAGRDAVRLWAVVGGGVLVRHKGVVSVTPDGAGVHTIRFDRDVSACAYGAVVLGTNGTFATGVMASVTTGLTLGGNDRVAVRTESAGTAVDARVSVTVAC